MKAILFFIMVITTSFSCKNEIVDCCVLPPEGSELNGNWEFVRVNYGFTNTIKTAAQLGYTERLEIDVANSRLIRFKNNKQVENTKFTILKKANYQVITFEESQEYSYLTVFVENDKTLLSLYDRAPVGVTLADGGTFYYEKK